MDLATYLFTRKISKVDFAKTMGVTRQTVMNWCSGTTPKLETRERIEEATGGMVEYSDWETSSKKVESD